MNIHEDKSTAREASRPSDVSWCNNVGHTNHSSDSVCLCPLRTPGEKMTKVIILKFFLADDEHLEGIDDIRAVDKWKHTRKLDAEVEEE